jgi:predicted Ser/Thr protein kinase
LPNGIVKKVYNRNNSLHIKRFNHELKIMQRLNGCDFVPQLLHADEKNTTLYMTHCGERPTGNEPFLHREVDKLMRRLETEYGLVRVENIGRKQYGYSGIKNLTIRNGKLFIIDFGTGRWKILPPPTLYQPTNSPIRDQISFTQQQSTTKSSTTPTANPATKPTMSKSPIVDLSRPLR